MSHWSTSRSFGAFLYFENAPPPARRLVEVLLDVSSGHDLQLSTKKNYLRWSRFSWKKCEAALASDSDANRLSFLVGTPQYVRLGSAITLRTEAKFREFLPPPLAWVGAEAATWSEADFTRMARSWLLVAASSGDALSGGVLAAATLQDAKMEMTQELEINSDRESPPPFPPMSFRGRLMAERPPSEARMKIRRVYPITLLGPRIASQIDPRELAAAGATNIQQVAGSIIFEASPTLLEAWSPEFLAATVKLRRLMWPLSFQNPADNPDPPPPQPSKPPRRGRQ